MDFFGPIVLLMLVAVAVGYVVRRGRWLAVLLCGIWVPTVTQVGKPLADSGPRWVLTSLFISGPLTLALTTGFLLRRSRAADA